MKPPIVHSSSPVTLVGGGELAHDDLALALSHAATLVAADSGAQAALAAGHVPHAVIGDFDSLSADARAQIPQARLHEISEQDSTDFDKVLRHVAAPLCLGVGFLGARLDHQLAVMNTLVRRAERPCVLIGAHEVVFHAPPEIALDLGPEDVVSLFPLARVTGRSEGLEWPIEGLVMEPHGRIGTSNRARGPLRLEVDAPGLLVMVPRRALASVTRAFLVPGHARWPARAG
ncbi:thiamine diphosphokinase [Lutimaribacter marinistellae]|uniref:Thiamine diphosphokinase n=1 Tax=Lutimaribacter marinistellae TaxID=1820329 RepID=A0ABV7TJN5_9RHOB